MNEKSIAALQKKSVSVTSPLKAIRIKCIDCMGYQPSEVANCPLKTCALYVFRFGKNPYNKRELTEEQRAAMSKRAKALIAKRGKFRTSKKEKESSV